MMEYYTAVNMVQPSANIVDDSHRHTAEQKEVDVRAQLYKVSKPQETQPTGLKGVVIIKRREVLV